MCFGQNSVDPLQVFVCLRLSIGKRQCCSFNLLESTGRQAGFVSGGIHEFAKPREHFCCRLTILLVVTQAFLQGIGTSYQ